MRKHTLILAMFLMGLNLTVGQSTNISSTEVKSVRIKNQKGGYWYKVCQDSTYVDSAGTISTVGTWKKDNTGFTCIAFQKENGKKPIQISTLWAKYRGSKPDSSLFDIVFKLKSISDDSVGSFTWASGMIMDTMVTVKSYSGAVAKRFYVGGLAFPEADSICFRLQPSVNTQNLSCAVDSTVGFIGIDLK